MSEHDEADEPTESTAPTDPSEPEAEPRPRRRMSRRTAAMVVSAVLLLALVAAAALLPVPYVALGPGPTFNTIGSYADKPLITVKGAPTFPTSGNLDLTTVSESGGPYGRLGLGEALRDWIDPHVAVVPEKLLYPPGTSQQQVEAQNDCDFAGAETSATVAALKYLGKPVTPVVAVGSVEIGGPSQSLVRCGDTIVAVDGTKVTGPDDVITGIRKHKAGDDVVLTLRRGGKDREVTIKTVPKQDGGKTNAAVGITLGVSYTSPITVTYSLQGVGGPSAGLMFSLGLVDKLTPESLNGGAYVAGTGTIDEQGKVGPIGGIQQKLRGARDKGATIFLVPSDNCAAALGAVPKGLRIVKVTTLSSAVAALDAIRAGKPTPTC